MVYKVYCIDSRGNEYFRDNKMLPYEAIKKCCKYGKGMEVWILDETGEYLFHICTGEEK